MIHARGLTFSYGRHSATVIDGLDLDVSAGEFVAIMGRSGAGKSTLLYLLGLLLRPNGGRIRLGGRDVATLSDRERSSIRAGQIGFVFQDAMLDDTRSVADNVLEGQVYRRARRAEARRRADLLMELLDIGIDPDRKPGQISGGQAQRVALCRALLAQPKIILGDEPTGNLDVETTELVLSVLRAEAGDGRGVVVVTHDPIVGGGADRIVEI